ncbi:MAG: hypothetical protein KZQ83_13315 [gamma proteobacterium symbiont of Taylorina sp.]|nr:hypothetical protein [gamma proteobacterium symbiont of Taylorina sp.]
MSNLKDRFEFNSTSLPRNPNQSHLARNQRSPANISNISEVPLGNRPQQSPNLLPSLSDNKQQVTPLANQFDKLNRPSLPGVANSLPFPGRLPNRQQNTNPTMQSIAQRFPDAQQ